jgi:hypothetical protein
MEKKKTKWSSQGQNKMRMPHQSNQKGRIKEGHDELRKNNDSKSAGHWNTFWAYESLYFITKNRNLHDMPL